MIFIRHGQSIFNVSFDYSGVDPHTPDAALSPLGCLQVEASAQELIGRGLTQIISSPYTRALQTASIVAKHLELPIKAEPLVGERRLYSCDIGQPVSVLKEAWPSVDFSMMEGQHEWWMPFHETVQDLEKRVQAFLKNIEAIGETSSTLVVSHWHFISAAAGVDMVNAGIVERA